MSYQDRRPDLGRDNRPPLGATARQARWSWVIATALVVALGVLFYAINAHENGQRTANPVAQTTTGQPTPPPAASETTGRGGTSAPGSR